MADEHMTVRLAQTGEVQTMPAWVAARLIDCGQAAAPAPVNRAEQATGRPPLALPEG